ncbi:MAG: hypothetical protein P8Y18_07540 [Candidatus Bathyarchaeota archaeon]
MKRPIIYDSKTGTLIKTIITKLKEFTEELYIGKIQSYWRI